MWVGHGLSVLSSLPLHGELPRQRGLFFHFLYSAIQVWFCSGKTITPTVFPRGEEKRKWQPPLLTPPPLWNSFRFYSGLLENPKLPFHFLSSPTRFIPTSLDTHFQWVLHVPLRGWSSLTSCQFSFSKCPATTLCHVVTAPIQKCLSPQKAFRFLPLIRSRGPPLRKRLS